MSEIVTYVHVAEDARFGCHLSDGSLLSIGSEPVEAPAEIVAYLDQCPFVKRDGSREVSPVNDQDALDLDDQEVDD